MDMDAQAQWHRILKPFKSMLKFRLPYTPGATTYLHGQIYLPVWGPTSTTECRLLVDTDAGERTYEHTEHEEKMFFFNSVTRPSLFPHDVNGCGLDHCYDCRAEVHILQRFLGHTRNRSQAIARLSAKISASISNQRTLATPNPGRDERIQAIRRRQWIGNRPAYEAARE
jgi:cap2 methyltransferase